MVNTSPEHGMKQDNRNTWGMQCWSKRQFHWSNTVPLVAALCLHWSWNETVSYTHTKKHWQQTDQQQQTYKATVVRLTRKQYSFSLPSQSLMYSKNSKKKEVDVLAILCPNWKFRLRRCHNRLLNIMGHMKMSQLTNLLKKKMAWSRNDQLK